MLRISHAAQVTGTTRRALGQWIQRRQLSWLAKDWGDDALFDDADLVRVRLVVCLSRYGATVAQAAEMVTWVFPPKMTGKNARQFLDGWYEECTHLIFVHGPDGVWSCTETNTLSKAKVPPAACIIATREVFDTMLKEAHEIEKRIKELKALKAA